MPFTPTHVVAVLPFWPLRRFLPFAALAIGSMMPDFPLFFPVVDYAQTHSPTGVFTFCLPLGVALFFFFETVMRRPLTALLPRWILRRIQTSPQIPTEPRLSMHLLYYTGIAVAIVIGAFTHQIWDAFTHQGRWGTQWIPSLNSDFPVGRHLIPGYKLLQYGSTFVGLPFLAILAAFELNRATPHDYETPTLPTKAKLLAASLAFVIPLAIGIFTYSTQASAYQALGITIKRSGAIIILLCLGYCVVFQTCTHGDAMRSKR